MTIFVNVGIMTEAHSFRSQVGIGSESDCLLGLSNKILRDFIFRGRLENREIRRSYRW